MEFTPECQAAIDWAKLCVTGVDKLDTGTLLAALVAKTNIAARFPNIVQNLPEIFPRSSVSGRIGLSEPLLQLFGGSSLDDLISPGTTRAGIERLAADIIDNAGGRKLLESKKVPSAKIDRFVAALRREGRRASPKRMAAIRALSEFGRMVTDSEFEDSAVVEMERPIKAVVNALMQMQRHNVLVVGLPGTGKSALVYEFARRLTTGHESIPVKLLDLEVFELSPTFLRAGTSVVGEYEERLKTLLKTLRAHPEIVLFVDEIHSMFKSGIDNPGPFTDANEAFKAVLGRGEITCIGCTTVSEYRAYIQPDGALERRFSILRLDPPSTEATIHILRAKRPAMATYFAPLGISDDALERIVSLSEEYLPKRYQPDKAIQLLDEACACSLTEFPDAKELSESAIMTALERATGRLARKVGALTEGEIYAGLTDQLVGQDTVLREIASAVTTGLGAWRRDTGPRGVYLFGGPTGVGKTEAALVLARIIGGSREALLRIDCGTLTGRDDDRGPLMARLLGPEPGYRGYARGQGGLLSKIRDIPNCVVLFDEFEKADPSLGKLLLRIFDDGELEDVDGNQLSFRRSFIVLTTNAGVRYGQVFGFRDNDDEDNDGIPDVSIDDVHKAIRGIGLGEEFIARITHTFLFWGLDEKAVAEIISRQLKRLDQAAELRGFDLTWSDALVTHLSNQWEPRLGARHLRVILRNRIVEQLGIAEAYGELDGVSEVNLSVLKDGTVSELSSGGGLARRRREKARLIIELV